MLLVSRWSGKVAIARWLILLAVAACVPVGCIDSSGPVVQPTSEIDGAAELLVVETDTIRHEDVKFSEYVGAPGKTVLVDFWAPWCGPCKMLGPEIEEVAKQAGDSLVVLKVNVDEEPQLAQHFQVSGIPDMRLFRNGEAVDSLVGFHSADQIRDRLQP